MPGGLRRRPAISAPGLFEVDDPETSRIADEFASALSVCRPLFAGMTRRCMMRLGRRFAALLGAVCISAMVDVHLLRIGT